MLERLFGTTRRVILGTIAPRMMMRPNKEQIEKKVVWLSMLYAFLGWNCGALILYKVLASSLPEDREERKEALKAAARGTNCQIIQIHGLSVVKNSDVDDQQKVDNKKLMTENQLTDLPKDAI